MLPRRVDGVERKALIRPIREQVHQPPLLQQPRHRIFHHLYDSIACQAENVHGDDIADDDVTICRHLYDSSATLEFPFERTPSLRVAIINQHMFVRHQVLRRSWMLVLFEVRGRSDGHDAGEPEFSHNRVRNRRVSDMNGNVEALAYQVAELITSDQFEFEVRVTFKKLPEPRSIQEMCKGAMHLHAQ